MTTNMDEVKIAKNKLLNWLYGESMNISVKKLGCWLEENTNGRYKLIDTQKQKENVKDSTR